ncbi:transposable element Tcb1 transposase [Trichonephila clavipes]|nr:transposable element Tcb1 transposase [Trichonephila clavipes]
MLLMYAQSDVKDDFPSTKAEKRGSHTILFFCRQFMSVRLSEESLVQARIRCLAFWIVTLEQKHWSVGDKLKRFKYTLKFPCPVRNWNFSTDTHHACLWRHLKALFKAWRFRRFQVRQLCFSCGFFKKRSVISRRKQQSAFDQVSEFDRGRIVAYRDCGLSFREIGSRVGRNQTTVMRICDRWMQEGTTDRRDRTHPPQCTTSREDRQIVRMAVTDRSDTSRTVAQHIESVTHHSVYARTIRRRLQQSGLSARRPLLGLPLTQNHKRLRRQWCNERRLWAAEWNEVVFTDESRICLQHHDGRIRVWRHRGERMLNSCVMHHHTGPAPGIMV